jgi:prephenate dehydrogenase
MIVGVHGLGRFGSFWAGLLCETCEVWASSRDPLKTAPPRVRHVRPEEVFSLPTVFLCVAIYAMEDVLERMADEIRSDALIMDTCSVKSYPMDLMTRILPETVSILGTHPMFGPDSARSGTRGLPMILCPGRIAEADLDRWKTIFESLGLGVKIMEAADHDREAAFTQGIAHYIGRVLKDLGIHESEIATMGYRKLLEIVEQTCNDPWQLFLDLQRYNPYTRDMRKRLKKSLDAIMAAIET